MGRDIFTSGWKTCVALGGALLLTAPAAAQVFEIGDGGALNVREGGGAVAWRDMRAEVKAVNPESDSPEQALTLVSAPIVPINYTEVLNQTAARHSLSPALLEAVVWQESRWHPQALSPKGAMGLTQLMPATARAMGVDPRDPVANLDGGARYLRQMLDRFSGNLENSLAAYNAGPGRVERAGGIPAIAETRAYVSAIMARLGNQVLGR
jgi:soluble lytic murein transglycosylase-like protein